MLQQHYVSVHKEEPFPQQISDFGPQATMPSFYDNSAASGGSDVSLGPYGGMSGHGGSTQQYALPSNHLTPPADTPSYGFGGQVDTASQLMGVPSVTHSVQEPSYTLSSPNHFDYPSPTLQYPTSSPGGSPTGFVSMAQISPSPTISPEALLAKLPDPGSPGSACDPMRTIHSSSGGSGRNSPTSAVGYDGDVVIDAAASARRRRGQQGEEPSAKRLRRMSTTSSSDESQATNGQSGESEKEEDDPEFEDGGEDDDDDDDYVVSSRPRVRRRVTRSQDGGLSSSATFSPTLTGSRRLSAPVPIPNLTKKSRGRRVPTEPVIVNQNGITKVCILTLLDLLTVC